MCEKVGKKFKSVQDGFTFIEIMMVIAVIGVLAGVLLPNIAGYWRQAKKAQAESTLRMLGQGIELYKTDTGVYPNALKDLVQKPADERAAKRWNGPYLKGTKVPEDPWGNKYQYTVSTEGGAHPYELSSKGPGGRSTPKSQWLSVWDEA
jgi:general secretion pathway protein G